MSKLLSKLAVAAIFLFLIVTSILYMVNLPRMLSTIQDHLEKAKISKCLDRVNLPKLIVLAKDSLTHKEYIWEKSQVVLPFSNAQYHITSDSDWASLFPTNGGRIPSLTNPDEEVMLSMHHQLHCLNIIRIAYLGLHTTPSTMPPVDYADVDMCLEQLRQHMMCNCDLTLEPTVLVRKKSDGVIAPGSTGIGVEHRCWDWEKLSGEVETMARR